MYEKYFVIIVYTIKYIIIINDINYYNRFFLSVKKDKNRIIPIKWK